MERFCQVLLPGTACRAPTENARTLLRRVAQQNHIRYDVALQHAELLAVERPVVVLDLIRRKIRDLAAGDRGGLLRGGRCVVMFVAGMRGNQKHASRMPLAATTASEASRERATWKIRRRECGRKYAGRAFRRGMLRTRGRFLERLHP